MPSESDFAPPKSDFAPPSPAAFPPHFLRALWLHFSDCPTKIALFNAKCPDDCVSFGELFVFSHSVAAFLLANCAFGRGSVACVALPNCWEYAAIFGGVGMRGGALSGANSLYTENELRQQFSDSKCQIVFCSVANLGRVINAARTIPIIKTIVVVESGKSKGPLTVLPSLPANCPIEIIQFGTVLRTEPILHSDQSLDQNIDPNRDLLLLPYSSGTTGCAKGVMISHHNWATMMDIAVTHFNKNMHPFLRPPYNPKEECDLLLLPFYHCFGFALLNKTLLNGSTGAVMGGFEQDLFCATVEQYKIRFLKIVPPVLVFLAKSPKVDKYDLSHVNAIFSGAAPAGADLCEELKRRFPNLQHIAQGYGMTEMSLAITLPVFDKERLESVGKLLDKLEMKIMDLSDGKEAEPGMPGELFVRGPTRMLGYLGRAAATAETIDADGWLRTGDIVYLDKEGFMNVVDRLKELIKVNGLQVAPSELEDLLLSHPDIQDCAVIGVPDKMSGELPKAFVVRRDGIDITEAQIKQFVKDRVVYYKQLKGGVEFVDEIPKSAAGKILRRLLRERSVNGLAKL